MLRVQHHLAQLNTTLPAQKTRARARASPKDPEFNLAQLHVCLNLYPPACGGHGCMDRPLPADRQTGRLDCNQPPTDTNFLLPSRALRNLCANSSAVCRPIAPADDIHYVAPGVLSSVTQ
jgi:hypothetical protein